MLGVADGIVLCRPLQLRDEARALRQQSVCLKRMCPRSDSRNLECSWGGERLTSSAAHGVGSQWLRVVECVQGPKSFVVALK